MYEPQPDNDELPPCSAELVLWRVHVEATLAVLGRKKAERCLRLMAEKLAGEENLSSVFQLRPATDAGSMRRSRRQAATAFQRYLPLFLARLPRE